MIEKMGTNAEPMKFVISPSLKALNPSIIDKSTSTNKQMPATRWMTLFSVAPIVTKVGAKTAPNHTKAIPLVRKKDVGIFMLAGMTCYVLDYLYGDCWTDCIYSSIDWKRSFDISGVGNSESLLLPRLYFAISSADNALRLLLSLVVSSAGLTSAGVLISSSNRANFSSKSLLAAMSLSFSIFSWLFSNYSATFALSYSHEIWILALKKWCQRLCPRPLPEKLQSIIGFLIEVENGAHSDRNL